MALLHQLLGAGGVAGRIAIGLIFLAAAVQKMRHWHLLPGIVGNYRLLPVFTITPAAAILPPLEMALGLLLLAGVLPVGAAVGSIALLLLFAVAMAVNIGRGRRFIDCGCGSASLKQTLSWWLVIRNLFLIALLLPCLAAGAMSVPLLMAGIAAGLAFALLYALFNTLSALPRPA